MSQSPHHMEGIDESGMDNWNLYVHVNVACVCIHYFCYVNICCMQLVYIIIFLSVSIIIYLSGGVCY